MHGQENAIALWRLLFVFFLDVSCNLISLPRTIGKGLANNLIEFTVPAIQDLERTASWQEKKTNERIKKTESGSADERTTLGVELNSGFLSLISFCSFIYFVVELQGISRRKQNGIIKRCLALFQRGNWCCHLIACCLCPQSIPMTASWRDPLMSDPAGVFEWRPGNKQMRSLFSENERFHTNCLLTALS